jgi:ATP-dependent Lhr-like helicase
MTGDSATPGLSPRVGRAFFGQFNALRPVQEQALPPALQGDDVLIRAGTGSGKTEAATAPLVQRHLRHLDAQDGTIIIYVSPTRALANDLARRLEPVLDRIGITVGVKHGERDDLAHIRPPEIVITTPESLDVLVGKKHEALRNVQAVVLDEVHLLYNNQRGMQLAVVLQRLELWLERLVQTIGLSATVADANSIWQFFRPGRPFTEIVDLVGRRPLECQVRQNVSHDELARLLGRLASGPPEKLLVFANSRRECDTLAAALRHSGEFGDHVYVHHSSLDRDERLFVERKFEAATRAICVATSTLELGIDIGNITLVVLYGVPIGWQSFLQRVGRGNRRSNSVHALAVVPEPRDGGTPPLRDRLGFQALLNQVATNALDGADTFQLYGAAAQQIVSIIEADQGYVGINRLFEVLAPWPHLQHDEVEAILDQLVDDDILRRHPAYRRYGASEGLHELRRTRSIWSNLPLGSREIELRQGNHSLGRVPASNLLRLRPGVRFTFSGRTWEVARADSDAVTVRPASPGGAVDLTYGIRRPGLDPGAAEAVRQLIHSGRAGENVVPAAARDALEQDFLPLAADLDAQHLPWTHVDGSFIYFTFAGAMANEVMAAWSAAPEATSTDVSIVSPTAIDFSGLPTDPRTLARFLDRIELPAEELSVYQNHLPAELRRREMANLWIHHRGHQQSLERLANARPIELSPLTAEPLLARSAR